MLARTDPDSVETGEWIDSLRAVLRYQGPERASFLLERLTEEAHRAGVSAPFFNPLPAVKRGTRLAAIWMRSPVRGFTPWRAPRLLT